MAAPKPQIYTNATDKTIIRIIPGLASEIGLNESIALLQISYWIGQYDNFVDGKWWVYKSTRDMVSDAFMFWSPATCNRAINSLIAKNLIHVTDKYNKKAYDKTRWFALNVEALSKLSSIAILMEQDGKAVVFQSETPLSQNETAPFQSETPLSQNETRSNQNETTIQEITTKTLTKNKTKNTEKDSSPGVEDEAGQSQEEQNSSKRTDVVAGDRNN